MSSAVTIVIFSAVWESGFGAREETVLLSGSMKPRVSSASSSAKTGKVPQSMNASSTKNSFWQMIRRKQVPNDDNNKKRVVDLYGVF